jgi:pyruvate dehydrogenase E2 component (dihydrolipoamide acetyltransferase)
MGAMKEVFVPDIGDFKDVDVIEILVKPGDAVQPEQSLITLESDKATIEIPSPSAGVVKELRVKLGDKVSEGTPILVLEASEAAAAAKAAAQAAAPAATAAPPPVAPPAAPPPAAAPTAPAAPTAKAAPPPASPVAIQAAPTARPAAPPPAAQPAPPLPARTPPVPAEAAEPARARPHASPSVRKFARELGVDLAAVKGSGPKNRILVADVQAFVKGVIAHGPAAAAPAGGGAGLNLLPWPKVDFAKFGPIETQPLARIKKISGANLARNWVMIPHVTNNDEADVTELEAFRVALNKEHEKAGIRVTMLAFLVKACVAALKKFPEFNSSLDGDNLVFKRYYHVGFAADTPNGLVVPVIKDADAKGVLDIARETSELAKQAREGKLKPADMQGGTFSISSLGGIGGTSFSPIINAPEVAILGVSRSAMKPFWDGKAFVPRLFLPLSLSYDHRVIDGAAAARFNAHLAQLLADFRRVSL